MLTMKAAVIVLLMCIKAVYTAPPQYTNTTIPAPCTTNPVAEGSKAVIKQTVSKTKVIDGKLKWIFINAGGTVMTVTECTIDDNPTCTSTLLGDNVYSSTMVTSGSDYRVTLTIHNVNRLRDQATWKWYSGAGDDSVSGQCDLDVYSFQSAPVCQTLGISSNGNTVSWTCTVSNVYPEMECRFEKKKGSGSWITQNVDTQKTTTDGKYPPLTVYHDYTCTLNLPVSQLGGEGMHQFRFTAAVVKGSSTLKTSLPIVKDLNLAYPQVELVGCPNADDSTQGYISEKDNTKTCQCRLKEMGNPPGVAQWRNAQISLVGQGGSLSLVYNPDDQAPTYTCRGYSGLGSGPAITYKPKFAYGPSAITIAFQPQSDTMNKCEPDSSFTTYCDIAMANVNPEPTTTVTVSDGSTVTELSGSKTAGHYRQKFKVAPEKGGTLTVTCSSFNPAFPDLKTDMSKTILVREPPQSSPVMTVGVGQQPMANSSIVTVTDGDDVQVTCRVDGGYPLVNEVTLTCAGVKTVNDGIQATQTIYVKKGDNNQKCICEAKHVTGCYPKTSEFTLNVRYTPTVTNYKANSKSTELTVSADDTVTFVCNAEGNPIPSVSVRGQRWDGVVTLQDTPSGAYGKESSGTKTMSCKDTDVYTCMADNGVRGGMSKNVSVFVECVPELPLTLIIQEFSPTNGTDLEIEISIIGFPEPKSYSLKWVSDNYKRKHAVTGFEIGEDYFKVTYIPDNPPKGVVVLTMMGLTGSDSGQYVLTIDNGIKDGLDYTFNISIISEKKDPSDDDDDDNDFVIGLVIGLVVAVVLTAFVCLVLVKVRTSRWAKERQLLQHQVQQQQHEIQEQQRQQRQRQQPQQPQRHPTHYEEISLNEYDGLNILDTQTQANGYQHIGPHDARERQIPIIETREDGSTEQRGGPITRQDSSYENEGFQTDHNHGSDVGPGSNDQNITRPDTSYANQDIGTDILEGGVERPGNYVNVTGFKESVAMTTDTNVAIDDTHVYLEPKDIVTETNESHSEYEIPDGCP